MGDEMQSPVLGNSFHEGLNQIAVKLDEMLALISNAQDTTRHLELTMGEMSCEEPEMENGSANAQLQLLKVNSDESTGEAEGSEVGLMVKSPTTPYSTRYHSLSRCQLTDLQLDHNLFHGDGEVPVSIRIPGDLLLLVNVEQIWVDIGSSKWDQGGMSLQIESSLVGLDSAYNVFDRITTPSTRAQTVDAFSINAGVPFAGTVFDKMPNRSFTSWNRKVARYAPRRQLRESLCLYNSEGDWMPRRLDSEFCFDLMPLVGGCQYVANRMKPDMTETTVATYTPYASDSLLISIFILLVMCIYHFRQTMRSLDVHMFSLNQIYSCYIVITWTVTMGEINAILVLGSDTKLTPHPYVPCQVLKEVGKMASQLFPSQSKLHPIFYVFLPQPTLPPYCSDGIFLTSLKLIVLGLTAAGLKAFDGVLQSNFFLKTLDLSVNPIGGEGANCLCDILVGNAGIQKLQLNVDLGDEGAKATVERLKIILSLHVLELNNTMIDYSRFLSFAGALLENNSIQSLYLNGNYCGALGAAALAKGLEKNKSLREIFLQGNFIGDEGVRALESTLQHLDFGNNAITSEVAFHVAEYVRESSLVFLNLSINDIGDEGDEKIAEELAWTCYNFYPSTPTKLAGKNYFFHRGQDMREGNQNLNQVLLSFDPGGSKLHPVVHVFLLKRKLGSTTITTTVLPHIIIAKVHSAISIVDLRANGLGDESAIRLAQSLTLVHGTLTSLDLGFNEIRGDGAFAIARAPKVDMTFITIFLISNLEDKVNQVLFPFDPGVVMPYPVAILSRRWIKYKGRPATQLLVQWSNSYREDATCEMYKDFIDKFPTFEPCGQGSIQGEGNDTSTAARGLFWLTTSGLDGENGPSVDKSPPE